METDPVRRNGVGAAVPWPAVIAAAVSVAFVVTGVVIWISRTEQGSTPLVLATGPESGIYDALGTALAREVERRGIVGDVVPRSTQGSVENMRLLEAGEVDLALVQSDTVPGANARLIATLFDEELHVLVARRLAGSIRTVLDLTGSRVSLGSPESGTRQVAQRILHHLDVEIGEDLQLPPVEAIASIEAGDIDAMFLLSAVPSPAVVQLAKTDTVRFLTLGDLQIQGNRADALELVDPRFHATVIPQSTYGNLPVAPILTVGVRAELIGSRDLDDETVYQITRTIFTSHGDPSKLSDEALAIAGRIRERYIRGYGSITYHPGAIAYYERFEPPFVVEYAEALSLGFTLLVGVWSASIAIRQWMRRRMKNRIDAYYIEVTRDAPDVTTASRAELLARRARLIQVRERAFADLVDEKLEANESFSIFQSQVAGELASIAVTLAHESW